MCILPHKLPPLPRPAAHHMGHHMVSLVFVCSTLPSFSSDPSYVELLVGCCVSRAVSRFSAFARAVSSGSGASLPHSTLHRLSTSASPRLPWSLPWHTYINTPSVSFLWILSPTKTQLGNPYSQVHASDSRENSILFSKIKWNEALKCLHNPFKIHDTLVTPWNIWNTWV